MTDIDLHGHQRQPFPDWGEEFTYLERVTVPDQGKAQELYCEELGDYSLDPPEPIWMRWATSVTDPLLFEDLHAEWDDGWMECKEDHPDAVPFWKDE